MMGTKSAKIALANIYENGGGQGTIGFGEVEIDPTASFREVAIADCSDPRINNLIQAAVEAGIATETDMLVLAVDNGLCSIGALPCSETLYLTTREKLKASGLQERKPAGVA